MRVLNSWLKWGERELCLAKVRQVKVIIIWQKERHCKCHTADT